MTINEIREKRMKEFGKFDSSDIDIRFLPYLYSGARVEVEWKEGYEDYFGYGSRTNGKKARFYVGISTGWKPILIQLYNKRSTGGQSIMSEAVHSIKKV